LVAGLLEWRTSAQIVKRLLSAPRVLSRTAAIRAEPRMRERDSSR
jgi:hypothetical protein